MMQEKIPLWRNLCRATMKEQDPSKLLELLRQINRELSESRTKESQPEPRSSFWMEIEASHGG